MLSYIWTISSLPFSERQYILFEDPYPEGMGLRTIKNIFSSLKSVQPDKYLQQVIAAFDNLNIQKSSWKFDPTLARGLDYYTGPIFETVVTKPKIGSITGGGRYDQAFRLIGWCRFARSGNNNRLRLGLWT